jgi:hypothetical protein
MQILWIEAYGKAAWIDDVWMLRSQLRGKNNNDGFEKVSRCGLRIPKKAANLPYAAVMKDEASGNAAMGIFAKPSQLGSRTPEVTSPPEAGKHS